MRVVLAVVAASAWATGAWAEASPPTKGQAARDLETAQAEIAALERQVAAACAEEVADELPNISMTLRLMGAMSLDAGQQAELHEALAQKLDDVAAICAP